MGLKIKYWTNSPVTVEDNDPKVTGRRTRKSPSKKVAAWTEVTVDASTLGITEELWDDDKNEDAKDAILKAIPGINIEFGIGAIRYQ